MTGTYKDLRMLLKKYKNKLIIISWADAREVTDGTWHTRDDVEKTLSSEVKSVGWVTHETDQDIKISADIPIDPEDDEVGRTTVIPRGCVKEIKEL